MKKKTYAKIPVNLVCGPLGVGKTTTINHWLAHRPKHERWAVLVNEYGLVGLDAALMESTAKPGMPGGVEIREVAGGCICCTAGVMFEASLVMLLRRRPARLLIEPTGLAALSGILDTLDRGGIREAVDVRSVACLLDPRRFEEDIRREQVQDQVEAADMLLASCSDLATTEQLEAFRSWAGSLFPPKRFVGSVEHGRVPVELLDLVSDRSRAVPRSGHRHGTDHTHHDVHADEVVADEQAAICDAAHPIVQRTHRSPVASTIGWICWNGLVFDAARSLGWIRQLAQQPGTRRVKAVLRTNEGWKGFNVVDGVEDVRSSSYRRDSRLEIVIEGDVVPDPEALEHALRDCLMASPSTAALAKEDE